MSHVNKIPIKPDIYKVITSPKTIKTVDKATLNFSRTCCTIGFKIA